MKIEIIGKFYDQHSLSIVNRNLILNSWQKLEEEGHDICITPLDTYDSMHQIDKEQIKILKKLESVEITDPDIQVRHSYPPVWRYPTSEKTHVVFIQPWEFQKVPMEWQYKWEQFADAVIVPSPWNGDVYLESGMDPDRLYVVPNGYNEKIFYKDKSEKSDLVPYNNKKVFTFVGNGQYRKGVDILLNAWSRCFKKADNVLLVIKDAPAIYGHNNILNEVIKLQYQQGCGEIIYCDDSLTEKEMAALYKNTDVIVHPFRGEGFGMHLQEAIACGCYPVVTQGGGPGYFINDNCGDIISTTRQYINFTDEKVVAVKPGDSLTLMNQHGWILEPNVDDLALKMRNLYHYINFEELQEKSKNAKITTWAQVGEIFRDTLIDIWDRKGDKPKRF